MAPMILRPLCDEDVPFVENWLRAEHVKPWFESPEAWLFEIDMRDGEFAFITHLIAETDGCWAWREKERQHENENRPDRHTWNRKKHGAAPD